MSQDRKCLYSIWENATFDLTFAVLNAKHREYRRMKGKLSSVRTDNLTCFALWKKTIAMDTPKIFTQKLR